MNELNKKQWRLIRKTLFILKRLKKNPEEWNGRDALEHNLGLCVRQKIPIEEVGEF